MKLPKPGTELFDLLTVISVCVLLLAVSVAVGIMIVGMINGSVLAVMALVIILIGLPCAWLYYSREDWM